ncbi:MAG: TetR/AcrR family transcriptional regulator [Anaerolineales bacterium]|nr:TetR/AcrR family transcriptional regulator [Anaerolineales bacterium]
MSKDAYHHGDLKNALIQAGAEILAREGTAALSLRKVAAKAGVSHSAPYAHFKDKQALIAAISADGFNRLYEQVSLTAESYAEDLPAMLLKVANAYASFALQNPACFKVMFSGVLEKEKEYPEFVDASQRNFRQLEELVAQWQAGGLLKAGDVQLQATALWSLVHGFIALLLENQISSRIVNRYPINVLLCRLVDQITLVDLEC